MCWIVDGGRHTGTLSICLAELDATEEEDIDYRSLQVADQKYIYCAIRDEETSEKDLDVLYAELARRTKAHKNRKGP